MKHGTMKPKTYGILIFVLLAALVVSLITAVMLEMRICLFRMYTV